MCPGFLLTSHWEDRNGRHVIRYYGRGPNGPIEIRITDQKPILFVESEKELPNGHYSRKSLSLKSFNGQKVDGIYFNSQRDLFENRDKWTGMGIRTFESDIRTPERFLMERFIKGSLDISGESQDENGIEVFYNPTIRPSSYRPNLSIMSFDIETSRGNDLYSIGFHFKDGTRVFKRVHMVGENQGSLQEGELFYHPDEQACYNAFENDVQLLDPDILAGWHVVGFDMAFLERKCQRWGRDLKLGRRKSKIKISEKTAAGQFARIEGRIVIDGPNALRAAFYQFEDFKLDTVAHELLGTGKDISATSLEKVEEIERRFREDKVALAKYNLVDCVLVNQILDKTDLLNLMITRTQISGMLIDRLGVSTAAFDFFMLPQIHRKGFVAPNVVDVVREVHAAGGFVLEPEVGLHEHVVVLDFKSLYPSIIRTFKIDPYSRLMAETNPVKNPAGIKFSETENILPEFIEELMHKRAMAKTTGDSHLSQAIKILMNSFYGVMGSAGSRFYHADLPTAITGTGQWILRETIEYFQNQGYEVLYGDTDSVFIKLKGAEYANPFEKGPSLAKKATEYITKVLRTHFEVESHLEMEFEKYYRKFFLPELRTRDGGAKKKYAGLLHLKSGEESIQFSGMEFVRSDWTSVAKKFQMQLFEIFFAGENIEDCVRNTVSELKSGQFDGELVYKKRLTKKLEEYTKSIPPHVRAALMLQDAGFEVGRDIRYFMTRRGPVPIELDHSDIDYQHYIEKQIRPIADTLLTSMGNSFDNIISGDQLSLF